MKELIVDILEKGFQTQTTQGPQKLELGYGWAV